tara:strand:+ start:394 stop:723 length:330 start_codon:yes stop_codon:yes gene_type:complete
MQRVGSRRQVWNRTAKQTTGGLTRSEIFQDKYGNLKSKKASRKAKRNKNLKKAGWTFKKGSFGAVRIEEKKKKGTKGKKRTKGRKSTKKRGRKQRGGGSCGAPPTNLGN